MVLNDIAEERYGHVESRKAEGAHYTPTEVADFIAQNMLSEFTPERSVRIVDPAVGDGELLVSLVNALEAMGVQEIDTWGFDTNSTSIQLTSDRLAKLFPGHSVNLHCRDFLDFCLASGDNSSNGQLFEESIPKFDLLIANPPYIRTQVLGSTQAQSLSKCFGLKGRVDIYQAFLVAMQSIIKDGGLAGVIVSNRFLTTKGAGKFRDIIYNSYELAGIWDFGDTKVFEAAVLPAVMLMRKCSDPMNEEIPFTSIYETTSGKELICEVEEVTQALDYEGNVGVRDKTYCVKQGHLSFDSKPSDLWRLQDTQSGAWLDHIDARTWRRFGEIGKIRVGVKTTADNVFIRDDWNSEVGFEPELLKPLTTHHIAGRFRPSMPPSKTILYTHQIVDGKKRPYALEDNPNSKKYLESHRDQLEGRKYVLKANRSWYEIWVPQNPSLWERGKVVFRDISEKPTFWFDGQGTVVNGDCYWMLIDDEKLSDDILWLVLAVANSTFIEEFYDIKFQNKLYSNRRRFITQYVEKFPLPNPEAEYSKKLMELARQCAEASSSSDVSSIETKIDELVWKSFELTPAQP